MPPCSHPFTLTCLSIVVAFILDAIIPIDREEPDETVHLHSYSKPESALVESKEMEAPKLSA